MINHFFRRIQAGAVGRMMEIQQLIGLGDSHTWIRNGFHYILGGDLLIYLFGGPPSLCKLIKNLCEDSNSASDERP